MDIQARTWSILDTARPGDRASRAFDVFILSLIVLNVIAAIIGTVNSIAAAYSSLLNAFEIFSVAVFTLEYIARLWSCVVDGRFATPVFGRIRFMAQPLSLVDVLAILPFYLPTLGIDLRSVRLLRLMRLARVLKLSRYSSSLRLMSAVVSGKKEELVITTTIMVMLLVLSASVLYFCENAAQPDDFSSIPAAMWWAVATLTTVGYGDMTPVTPLGRLVGAVVAILGIGMFALPTAIIGAGFVEQIQRRKRIRSVCPRCGAELDP